MFFRGVCFTQLQLQMETEAKTLSGRLSDERTVRNVFQNSLNLEWSG